MEGKMALGLKERLGDHSILAYLNGVAYTLM